MYTNKWLQKHPERPWMAETLKGEIIQALEYSMPSLVSRINHHFDNNVQGDFLEIRAYPESTFNLRVEELFVDGKPDKTPFPFILERLLDMQRNCFLLYVSNTGQDKLIYPLDPEGQRLGEGIKNFIYES